MIYYFSGTGNSRFVATRLGELLGENVCSINSPDSESMPMSGQSVGFVFPVYSWGVPPNVLSFIGNMPVEFRTRLKESGISVWGVMTCGDEVALAPEMFADALRRNGIEAESIWSVIMPNNYVLLPGFDVDSKDVEKSKLDKAPSRVKEIANGILAHRRVWDVTRGSMPRLKTKLIYPLFKKWGIFPKKWHYTEACIGCGKCASSCPQRNIRMVARYPKWGPDCCSCLACYHSCPFHAVEYGSVTSGKGQYHFPGLLRKQDC